MNHGKRRRDFDSSAIDLHPDAIRGAAARSEVVRACVRRQIQPGRVLDHLRRTQGAAGADDEVRAQLGQDRAGHEQAGASHRQHGAAHG